MVKPSKKKHKPKEIIGIVRLHAKGFGWLDPLNGEKQSYFVPPSELAGIWDGDEVRGQLVSHPKGPTISILEITKRAKERVIGIYSVFRGKPCLRSYDGSYRETLLLKDVPYSARSELNEEILVEAKITKFPSQDSYGEVSFLRSVGKIGELSSEIETILIQANVERRFSGQAERLAQAMGANPTEEEAKGRFDIRSLPLCTIDGETAKDFDDAVYAEEQAGGFYLVVAIADVAHYVKEGSPLDEEAYGRATSIYYPGKCIPMLPEAISNGLCSLKPDVPRLCMVAEIWIGKKGGIKRVKLSNGIMLSKARLTYTQVQKWLDETDKSNVSEEVGNSLKALVKVSRLFRKARQARGAIDFDITESVVTLDDLGEPLGIRPLERLEAHRLIEDLMVAANEAVASYLTEKGWPCVFRIHEPPNSEKLKLFLDFAQKLAAISPKQFRQIEQEDLSPKLLADLMGSIANHPAKATLETSLLRSMMQARYSTANVGHFGLASEFYAHFTSPIRRYPDLIVHRLIKKALAQPKKRLSEAQKSDMEENLEIAATHCSDQERKATQIERDIAALYAAWMMREHVGDQLEGEVTSCTEFGFFVRLKLVHVEGLVHVSTLKGRWQYNAERLKWTGPTPDDVIQMGNPVTIKVTGVNIQKRHVDFELLGVVS